MWSILSPGEKSTRICWALFFLFTSLRKFGPRGANVRIFHYWQLFSPNHYRFLTQFSKQCCGDDEVIPDLYKSNALVSEHVAMTDEGITGHWCTKGLFCTSMGNCSGHTRDIFFTLLAIASICALLSLSCTRCKVTQWLCPIRLHFSLLHNSSLAVAGIRTPARRCMIWNSSQQRWAELSCGGCFPCCLFDVPFDTSGLKENNLPRIHVTEKNTQSSTGVLAHRDMTETHKSDMYWQKTETGGEYFCCAVQSQTVYLNSANTAQNKPVRQPGCYMTQHDRYAWIFNMDEAKNVTMETIMPIA